MINDAIVFDRKSFNMRYGSESYNIIYIACSIRMMICMDDWELLS